MDAENEVLKLRQEVENLEQAPPPKVTTRDLVASVEEKMELDPLLNGEETEYRRKYRKRSFFSKLLSCFGAF